MRWESNKFNVCALIILNKQTGRDEFEFDDNWDVEQIQIIFKFLEGKKEKLLYVHYIYVVFVVDTLCDNHFIC